MRQQLRHRALHRQAIAVIALIALAGCTNGQPSEKAETPTPAAAAETNVALPTPVSAADVEMPADARGRSPYTYCIDLIREKRFDEALEICRKAESIDPGNLEIRHAVQIAQEKSGAAESPTP